MTSSTRDAAPASEPRLSRMPLLRRDAYGSAYHVLTFEADAPILAAPGHFAMVRGATWGQAPLLPRPMSLLTPGVRPSILIKVVGDGTNRMAHASEGELFDVLAPLGTPFSACPRELSPVLVAGGVGVAPLAFFAQALAERARSGHGVAPLTLYGGRTADDLPLDDVLERAGELRVATEDGSRGARGRVTLLLSRALDELGGAAKVYACGPDRMMAAVAALCGERGVSCEVSLEAPMACGYGVCLGCPVPKVGGGYLYTCTEGPCVDAARVDWARGGGS